MFIYLFRFSYYVDVVDVLGCCVTCLFTDLRVCHVIVVYSVLCCLSFVIGLVVYGFVYRLAFSVLCVPFLCDVC